MYRITSYSPPFGYTTIYKFYYLIIFFTQKEQLFNCSFCLGLSVAACLTRNATLRTVESMITSHVLRVHLIHLNIVALFGSRIVAPGNAIRVMTSGITSSTMVRNHSATIIVVPRHIQHSLKLIQAIACRLILAFFHYYVKLL